MPACPAPVLFDIDGFIGHRVPGHLRVVQLADAGEGIQVTCDEYFIECIGYDDPGAWRRLFALRRRPLDEATLRRAMERKFARMRELLETNEIPALPGAVELVQA